MCEHWLLPHELNSVKCHYAAIGKSVYLKSSVDPLAHTRGRLFGWLGFVCDKEDDLSYMRNVLLTGYVVSN